MFEERRPWEISSANLGIWMVCCWSWEISKGDKLNRLSHEPVGFHWPEWENVNVVHNRVWMWHVSIELFNDKL